MHREASAGVLSRPHHQFVQLLHPFSSLLILLIPLSLHLEFQPKRPQRTAPGSHFPKKLDEAPSLAPRLTKSEKERRNGMKVGAPRNGSRNARNHSRQPDLAPLDDGAESLLA